MLFLVVVVFFREMSKCQDFLLFYPFLMLFPFTIMLLQFLLFALLFSPFFLALSVRYMSTSFFFPSLVLDGICVRGLLPLSVFIVWPTIHLYLGSSLEVRVNNESSIE